jgi:ribosome-binding protein aMBF1 (putative translation factor)
MIQNEKQYLITKAARERFEKALQQQVERKNSGADKGRIHPRIHPRVQQAQIDALQSEIDVLQEQINEYEELQRGERGGILNSVLLNDIPRTLIQARIAAGLTQKDLAERLGLKEQQIQRYEASGYASASLRRLQEIAEAIS